MVAAWSPLYRGCGARDVAVGGVGVNLAVQDAVAAANILGRVLRESRLEENILRKYKRAANGRPASSSASSWRSKTAWLHRHWSDRTVQAALAVKLIMKFPDCASCRPGWSDWACGLSMSRRNAGSAT